MAESKSYKIDKNKDAMATSPWSEVDKTDLRNKIIEASNAKTLVKSVYLKIDSDWEKAPSERLHYPVMQFKGDTLVYNRNALSNALARAVQNNEDAVIDKIKKIYKSLGLEQDGKEDDAKMAEIAFAAVDIGDMWGKVFDALHAKYPDGDWGSVYRIEGIYEESNKKFAIIRRKDEDTKYRLDFSLTEEGLTLADEIVKVELEIIETDEVKKFAEPENANKYKKFEDRGCDEGEDDDDDDHDDDDEVEMSADEMKDKISKMQCDIEDRDNIIMQKDAELEELRKFKAEIEEKEKMACVDKLMSEVKNCMSEDKYNEFREEGVKCSKEELAGWENKVKAFCFETVQKTSKVDTKFMAFAGPIEIQQNEPKNVWDRIKQRNNFN